MRTGRANKNLERMEKALGVIQTGKAELAARHLAAVVENAPARRRLRDEEDARRERHKALAPVVGALEFVRRRAHPELRGCTLVADRLSAEEGQELSALVSKAKAILFRDGAELLSEAEERRYEELVGVSAGEPAIFERKRQEDEAKTKLAGLKDKRHVNSLPRRPELAEPGSVTLPRFAVHTWLENDRGGDWTVADLGALVAILGCFENRDARLIANARLEESEGESVLIIPGGPGAELRFARAIGGDSVDPTSSGYVRLRPALATLVRNQWLSAEVTAAETRIQLGPRAKEARGQAG